jgi:hypothetical protein
LTRWKEAKITGAYEGTYGDLVQYVNRLDKSARFLIVDSLHATPVQGTNNLNVTVKLNTFVREESSVPPVTATEKPVVAEARR